MASSKCARVIDASGPAWITPATAMATSIGPSPRSTDWTIVSTAAASATSQTTVRTLMPSAFSAASACCSSAAERAQITSR